MVTKYGSEVSINQEVSVMLTCTHNSQLIPDQLHTAQSLMYPRNEGSVGQLSDQSTPQPIVDQNLFFNFKYVESELMLSSCSVNKMHRQMLPSNSIVDEEGITKDMHHALYISHCSSAFVHHALFIMHSSPCTVHHALFTMNCLPSAVPH
ncbi:hypothetical protein HELRODRAFT_159280 [Helobdella robusta]|uniref:Uncharacterized protein n=1 Tax=Helobdella robusta TaxID=6412 RepID=T1ENT8_HELRO|nr:hypothetical protein HELRODRAFT_159280 [Helobdella robusta]ESO12696.1 hypothetical protein HELRODRAFT_159280 [Helobdella robusta]